MQLQDFVINDIKPLSPSDKISDLQMLFNQLTYSHIPIQNNGVYLGCISETDAHCFESLKNVQARRLRETGQKSNSLEPYYQRK